MPTLKLSMLTAFVLTSSLIAQTAPPASGNAPQPLIAQTGDVSEKKSDEQDDMDALRRWIRDKRMVSIKELGGDLSLSAEVRTEFQATNEKARAHGSSGGFVRQRGKGAPIRKGADMPRSMYAWDVELNLMLDYRTDRAWAATRLEFDNDMGQRSGTQDHIRLERAYLGGRIIAGETFSVDSEIGRRFLFNIVDSKIEFSTVFDGLLFRFSKAFPFMGDYYVLPGAFLTNDVDNHYGLLVEMGGLRIANTGLNIKYSIIDWYRPGGELETGLTAAQNEAAQLRYKFLCSQLQFQYLFYPEWIDKRLIKLYAAGLTNHLASALAITNNQRQNWAWYLGATVGIVKKRGDFSIDANYQWVQAQAVPEFDSNGIGRGNALGLGFYTTNANGSGTPNTSSTEPVGNTNFKGFEIEGLYAITDNITVQQSYKMSWTLDLNIGPNIKYKQYELEFIYAF